jgi:hypothetical protein
VAVLHGGTTAQHGIYRHSRYRPSCHYSLCFIVKKSMEKGLRDGEAEAYKYGMAKFVPADGEEFERDDHHSCAWNGPQTE